MIDRSRLARLITRATREWAAPRAPNPSKAVSKLVRAAPGCGRPRPPAPSPKQSGCELSASLLTSPLSISSEAKSPLSVSERGPGLTGVVLGVLSWVCRSPPPPGAGFDFWMGTRAKKSNPAPGGGGLRQSQTKPPKTTLARNRGVRSPRRGRVPMRFETASYFSPVWSITGTRASIAASMKASTPPSSIRVPIGNSIVVPSAFKQRN